MHAAAGGDRVGEGGGRRGRFVGTAALERAPAAGRRGAELPDEPARRRVAGRALEPEQPGRDVGPGRRETLDRGGLRLRGGTGENTLGHA